MPKTNPVAGRALGTAREDVLRAAGPPRSRNRWRVWVLSLVLAVAAVGIALSLSGREPPPPSYVTVPLVRGDLVETVTAVGTLAPLDAVEVGAEVTGRLTRVPVDVNDRVEAGQVLAEIDPEQLRARVRESRAQLESATANHASAIASLHEAERRAQRLASLFTEGIATRDEAEAAQATLERAQANVGVAQAQITVARASLASAETQLGRAQIRAPITGIVLSRAVEPGQTVTAGFQTPVLFTLARDLTQLELEVEVDEADIGKVREGQTASFVVDAYPGRTFTSKVLELHNVPKAEATIVTYAAVLAVDNSDLALRPGMTATAAIVTDELEDVLLADNAALRFEPPRPSAARRRGFFPFPGFRRRGGPRAGGGAEAAPARPPSDRIHVLGSTGELVAVPVEVLATDGERSAVSQRVPPQTKPVQAPEPAPPSGNGVALEPGLKVVIDVRSGGGV